MPRSRRTLLKTTGFALSTGTLASIAGCFSDPSIGSGSSPDKSLTSTPPGRTEAMDFTQ